MKKNLLVFLLGISPLVCSAEAISESRAAATAARFFAGEAPRYSRSTALPLKLVWKGQSKTGRGATSATPAFYIYNRGDNQGFVIVAGDNVVKPILAYAHEGTFGVDNIPDHLKGWMTSREKQIGFLQSKGAVATDEVKAAWQTLAAGKPVVLLHTVKWDQEYPYNTLLPGWNGWHSYVGCAVTATSIVMAHHQWPDNGVGTTSSYYASDMGEQIPAIKLGHPYLWEKMPELCQYNEYPMEVQAAAVSTLTRDVGYLMKANYGYSSTGARIQNAATKLPKHMKYRPEAFYIDQKGSMLSDLVWKKLLKHELDHNRPIVFAGYNSYSTLGHAFVLDGYDTEDYFSVNWGWSGRSNGFFSLGNLYPFEQGAGGGDYDFTEAQEAVLRLLPNKSGSEYEVFDYVIFTGTNYVSKGLNLYDTTQPLNPGAEVVITAGRFANFSTRPYTSALRLAVTDASGKIKQVLHTTVERHLAPGQGMMPFDENRDKVSVTLPHAIAEGDRIRLMYQATDQSWKPVVCEDSDGQWEIVLKEGGQQQEEIVVNTAAGDNLAGRAIATFSADYPTTPSNPHIEAFYAEQKDASTIVLKKINKQNEVLVIPDNVGVVLSSDGPSQFTMIPSEAATAQVPGSNLLKPTGKAGLWIDESINAYALAKRDNHILFHLLGTENRTIPAHRSYLELPSDMNATSVKMVFDDEATGIEPLTLSDKNAAIYDLSGRKVSSVMKGGVYIRNGKKFIVK